MGELAFIILGIFLFQLLVIAHEYGHFLVAKRNGVKVDEFGLGFPPRIVGKKMGRGIFRSFYSLNWLPLGGFVRLRGEHDTAEDEGSYGSKSLWVKAKIILAGVVVNYMVAVLIFTILAVVGIPRLLPADPISSESQFTVASDTKIVESRVFLAQIADGSPAAEAGLKSGYQILTIAGEEVDSSERLNQLTKANSGNQVEIEYINDQSQLVKVVADFNSETEVQAANEAGQSIGYLGVSSADFVLQRSTWSAPITGVGVSLQYTKLTLQGLWSAVTSLVSGDTAKASENVSGPVGIFFVLKQSTTLGYEYLLMIIAIISLSLAIMNALPIPALDGGRLYLTIFFRKVLKKPLSKESEEKIVGYSMMALLGLMVIITIVDVQRFF